MINREVFIATIMSFPSEFAKFAHAYGSYCGELKKAQKMIPAEAMLNSVSVEESSYNPNVSRMANWAAVELFSLNRISKETRNMGFLNSRVGNDEKENLINEAFTIVTSLSMK